MPGAKKGERRGGRTPGTPNKRSVELLKGLLAQDCVPAARLAALLSAPGVGAAEQIDCWQLLLPYLYPRLNAIDPDGVLTIDQAAGMLGAQALRFRQALERHVADPMTVALVMDELRMGSGS